MRLKNKVLSVLCAVALSMCVCSCGEDRTYQYIEKTSEARWVESAVAEWYLWADSMPVLDWKDYFAGSEDFLKKLTSKIHPGDKWSYSEVDSLQKDYHTRGCFDHLNSYGLDVAVMKDPTGNTSRQYLRVTTVYAGSPAERCGLQRNDFISMVNGQKVTSSSVSNLVSGLARTVVVTKLLYNIDEQAYYWDEADTLELGVSEYVEDKAFPVDSVYDVNGYKVGYLMCNRLVASAYERGSSAGEYRMALDEAMSQFKSAGVGAMVLDLRLCNYGEMDMVSRLATYLIGAKKDVLLQTLWKESKSDRNETFGPDMSVADKSLGLERVYVILGKYTQGAAEWLVQGLKGALGAEYVFTFGQTTAGQNVWLHPVESTADGVTLHLASAYVADADGGCDYSGGHVPMEVIDEFSFAELYPYGDVREVLLSTVIEKMIPIEGF